MKLYDLNSVKKKFKDKNPNFSRIDLENFFCKKNIYGKIIQKFYTHQLDLNNDFINEEDLDKIVLLAKLKFNDINLNYSNFKHFIFDENTFEHNIQSHNDYIEKLIQFRKYSQSEQFKEKKEEKKINFINLTKGKEIIDGISIENINEKKILSLDFEYKVKKFITFNYCFEFGVTTYENKKIKHMHFIIENENLNVSKIKRKLQNKFNFGESNTVKLDEVYDILNNLISNTDYLLLHGASNELKILKDNKIIIPENTAIIDTQKTKENFFNDKLNGSALNKLLKSFNIPFKNLHNAGNDAAFTMILFLKMYNKQKLELKKKVKNKIN